MLIADACFLRSELQSLFEILFPGCLSPVSDVLQDGVDDNNDGDFGDVDDGENEG